MPTAFARRAGAGRRPPFCRVAGVLAVGLLGALGACGGDDDLTGPGDVDIASVRLTVTPAGGAAATYTVTANSESAAPIALRVGTSTIRAEPLDENGQVSGEADEFELQLSGLPAGVTATRNGLTNTVTATAAVATPTRVEADMYHVAEGHEDYTAIFRVTVAP